MKSLEKKIKWPQAGKYVLAFSGGVDSSALLHLFSEKADYDIAVAHFNHGWQGDDDYEQAVRKALSRYDLPLKVEQGHTERSEEAARIARYAFLRRVKKEVGAKAIITAHHLDDLEETVVLNLERGTGRRGLTPFRTVEDVVRPLVGVRKAQLREYAEKNQLTWCHDSYNDDLKFARNKIRHEVKPSLGSIEDLLSEASLLNRKIDERLAELFSIDEEGAEVDMEVVRQLDLSVLTELIVMMVYAIRPGTELDRRTVEALAVDLKTSRVHRPRSLTKELSAGVSHGTFRVVFTP